MQNPLGKRPPSTPLPTLTRLEMSLRSFIEAIGYARRMHREYLALSALSDVELREIGIARCDLAAVVLEAPGRHTARDDALPARMSRTRSSPKAPSQLLANSKASRLEENLMSNLSTNAVANEIDVRSLVPVKRHEKIFQLVNQLTPGSSFILVNDHDPKPLYYQLEAEYPRQFSWTYLEKGPEAWRVEIGRAPKVA